MRVHTWDVDRDRVFVADVFCERLGRLAVQHDDAHHPLHAREEIVLAALVVVEATDGPLAREDEIGLAHRLR